MPVMEIIEQITINLDINNLVTTGVFIGLKKTFDTVTHYFDNVGCFETGLMDILRPLLCTR